MSTPRAFQIVIFVVMCLLAWANEPTMQPTELNSDPDQQVHAHNGTNLIIELPTSSPTLILAPILHNLTTSSTSSNGTGPADVEERTPAIYSSAHTCAMLDPITKQPRPIKIVTSSNDEYFPVLMNWLVYFHKHCSNVAIIHLICMDAIVEKKAEQHGLTCGSVIHVSRQNHHEIWSARVKLAQKLLASGHDVLMSDSDAVWLQNPFSYLEQFTSSDIIASRGSFPEHIARSLGATICMGFIYVRASEHTVGLWGELSVYMSRQAKADDQRDLNALLNALHLRYSNPKPTYVGSSTPSTGHFQHKNHNFAVTLLPHNTFLRICDAKKTQQVHNSIVAHCLAHAKTVEAKKGTSEALGLWLLRGDWQTVKQQSNMDAYLTSITADDMRGRIKRKVRAMLPTDSNHIVTTNNHYSGDGDSDKVPICVEYFSNRELFHSLAGRAGRYSCWYVSHSAPDSTIREFERIVSL